MKVLKKMINDKNGTGSSLPKEESDLIQDLGVEFYWRGWIKTRNTVFDNNVKQHECKTRMPLITMI